MFEHPTITVTVIVMLGAVGAGIGVLSLRRRRKVRRLCSEAAQAIEQNRPNDALRVLLVVERNWIFNSHDGSRASKLADLDDFTRILSLLARLPSAWCDASWITRIETVIVELRAVFSDRGNFGIDGRSMKKGAADRWSELSDRFQTLRQEFRTTCKTTTTTHLEPPSKNS